MLADGARVQQGKGMAAEECCRGGGYGSFQGNARGAEQHFSCRLPWLHQEVRGALLQGLSWRSQVLLHPCQSMSLCSSSVPLLFSEVTDSEDCCSVFSVSATTWCCGCSHSYPRCTVKYINACLTLESLYTSPAALPWYTHKLFRVPTTAHDSSIAWLSAFSCDCSVI